MSEKLHPDDDRSIEVEQHIYHDVIDKRNLEKLMDEFISCNIKRATVLAENIIWIFLHVYF